MKAAAEFDFLESTSSSTSKGTGGVKAASVASAKSRRQAEPQPLLNSLITICGAICPLKGRQLSKGRVDSLNRSKQRHIHPQAHPNKSQSLKRKNLPLQQPEEIENGLFIEA